MRSQIEGTCTKNVELCCIVFPINLFYYYYHLLHLYSPPINMSQRCCKYNTHGIGDNRKIMIRGSSGKTQDIAEQVSKRATYYRVRFLKSSIHKLKYSWQKIYQVCAPKKSDDFPFFLKIHMLGELAVELAVYFSRLEQCRQIFSHRIWQSCNHASVQLQTYCPDYIDTQGCIQILKKRVRNTFSTGPVALYAWMHGFSISWHYFCFSIKGRLRLGFTGMKTYLWIWRME